MDYSLYLHIPFCTHRCAYCDFNTYAGLEELIPAYVDALCREIELVGQTAPAAALVHTIFFGGGTPSLLTGRQVQRILSAVSTAFRLDRDVEITLEANPGTVSLHQLSELRSSGVNRISFGVQSANGEELRLLERTHNYGDVLRSVAEARRAGFTNLNLDLIYGLPGQTLERWSTTLLRILDMGPEHLAAYCLTLEHGTPFGKWSARGLMAIAEPDLAAEMYELAERELGSAGYGHYEISNWSKNGYQCRHNLQYWRAGPYFGVGAGAHGYVGGFRYSNVLSIREYAARLSPSSLALHPGAPKDAPAQLEARSEPISSPWSPAAVNHSPQTTEDEMADYMIMGLRLTDEGISPRGFQARFGRAIDEVYAGQFSKLIRQGLIERSPTSTSQSEPAPEFGVRLTERGRLLGNRVFCEFVN